MTEPALALSRGEPPPVDDHARRAALLISAQHGRREALDQLVVELTPMLWQVARAQGLDRDASQDVVQVVWLELVGSLKRIHSPQALTSWLITVARREAWRAKRAGLVERPSSGALTGALSAEDADPAAGPEDLLVDAERRRWLWGAVSQLPERCQRLLRVVAFIPRPDYDSVGASLGMPRGSIGPTRGRCLAKLRVLLGATQEGGWR